jgi:PIN domain nuclease of toxin-antitoxin system
LRLLLDTHIFLWLQSDPDRLGEHLRTIERPETELLVSAVVAWEIAIKYRSGRLPLPEPPDRYVPDRMRRIDATSLPISHAHALAAATLPPLHTDPFDRLLVAQSQVLHLPVLTADSAIADYPIRTLLV